MSKLDLTSIEDSHLTDKLLSAWIELFRQATNKFPDSIIVTLEQAKKFFYSAGELMQNYRGVPIEIQAKAYETGTILRTIDTVLKGMHTSAAKDVAEVYRLLEQMKEKIKGEHNHV